MLVQMQEDPKMPHVVKHSPRVPYKFTAKHIPTGFENIAKASSRMLTATVLGTEEKDRHPQAPSTSQR